MKIDKIVFITGGDKGIGRAIVQKMSNLYQKVIFTYNTNHDGANSLTQEFANTFAFQCDLSDYNQIKELAATVLQKYGRVDVLINNAGYESDALFTKMEEEQWNTVLDINLKSIYYFAHTFAPSMVTNGWGRIINLTSIAAYTGAFGKSNYATAKAGIVGFTKSIAMELAAKGITVNAIAPGAIETDMLMRIPEKYRDKILENIPSKQFGKPSDVAHLAEFLVSENASYINGQIIHINGGSYSI